MPDTSCSPPAFTLEEIDRNRLALIAYKMAHGESDQWLSDRIRVVTGITIPRRTLARYLAGKPDEERRTRRGMNGLYLLACFRFVASLPEKPNEMQQLADSVRALYRITEPPIQPGTYTVRAGSAQSTVRLTLSGNVFTVREDQRPKIWDGIMFFVDAVGFCILRDRSQQSPRFHVLHSDRSTVQYMAPNGLEAIVIETIWERG